MTTQPSNSNSNSRVRNAELKKDIEHLTQRVDEATEESREWRKQADGRLRKIERCTAQGETRWESHYKEHGRLQSEQTEMRGDIKKASAVGGGVGAFFAIAWAFIKDYIT